LLGEVGGGQLVIPASRVATVRENQILFKVREKSGRFVSGQGISKSLFKVSENYFIRCFRIDKAILF